MIELRAPRLLTMPDAMIRGEALNACFNVVLSLLHVLQRPFLAAGVVSAGQGQVGAKEATRKLERHLNLRSEAVGGSHRDLGTCGEASDARI